MGKSLLTITIFLFSLSVFASDSQHMNMNMSHGKKEAKTNTKRMSLDGESKKEVLRIFKANEELHEAFFDYNSERVEKNAKKLQEAIGEVKNEEIKKLLSFSQKKLSEIKADRDRKENNQTYHLVSMALIHIMNKYDVGDKYNAYSCPMVKKKWIQNSMKTSKVHNPYMAGMPHCGSQDSHH